MRQTTEIAKMAHYLATRHTWHEAYVWIITDVPQADAALAAMAAIGTLLPVPMPPRTFAVLSLLWPAGTPNEPAAIAPIHIAEPWMHTRARLNFQLRHAEHGPPEPARELRLA